jgi:hypothetical protein
VQRCFGHNSDSFRNNLFLLFARTHGRLAVTAAFSGKNGARPTVPGRRPSQNRAASGQSERAVTRSGDARAFFAWSRDPNNVCNSGF